MSTDVLEALTLEENRDIVAELTDPNYAGRRHYNKSLYAAGCRGPLCRKRERDLARSARAALAAAEGRVYQPGRTPRQDERDEFLERVTAWHHERLAWHRDHLRTLREREELQKKLKTKQKQAAELLSKIEGLSA